MEYYTEMRKYVDHRPLMHNSVIIIQNEHGAVLLQVGKPGLLSSNKKFSEKCL